MKTLVIISLIFSLQIENVFNQCQNSDSQWILSEILESKDKSSFEVSGEPTIIDSKYGKAVEFDGTDDGLFVDEMPLKGLKVFTVEAIFSPYSNGNFEQRFLHIGEPNGSRILLEIRATEKDWYFDAFVKSGNNGKALIDSTLLHSLDKWYHVAFVVNNGMLTSYVNGKKELEAEFEWDSTIDTGRTSMGTRMDKRSWFNGAIYKARVTPKALNPDEFLNF
jgi:hypothetical protein